MADVFISYARPDSRLAGRIAASLRESGLSVWFDKDLPAHRSYSEVIEEQLEAASAVLVLWSKDSAASQWVRSEANRARESGRLVQLRLDDARLPMPFDQIQCADLTGWSGDTAADSWRTIETSVAALLGREPAPATPAPRRSRAIDRRALLAGGVAIAAAGTGLFLLDREPPPPPEVQQLLQNALVIMQDGRPEEQDQAIAYLLEATRIAPEFAPAWGALALTYALRKYQVPLAERAGSEERCRSAARRALELEPGQFYAEGALALLVPTYRNWAKVEEIGQRLSKRHPDVPLSHHVLADSLVDAGRWKESIPVFDRINRDRFLIPLSDRSIMQGLWGAGELQRAEAMLDGAAQRWPRHRAIWNFKAEFLMHSGRAGEALLHLNNASSRPPGYPDDLLGGAVATARALSGSMPPADALAANLAMLETAPSDYLTYLNHKIATVQMVAQRSVALGDNRTALELLDGYYFGRGRWAKHAPAAGDDDRNTICLFEPAMRRIWRDPGFADLLRRVGLEAHWKATGTAPDFRRNA
jgi:tetratricopeptide (TPR) repeat protein